MRRLLIALAFAVLSFCVPCAAAQNAVTPTPNRVPGPIDDNERVALKGNVHPLVQKQFDQGTAPGSTPTGRIILVLQRSTAQQRALTQYLNDLQSPASPAYHNWLTPAQYGDAYGISRSDLLSVQSWLETYGFKIEKVPAAHNVIEFSGTFGQVEAAFHTSIHKLSGNGETHFANVSDPQIPAALAPVIAGGGPLNDFHPKPTLVLGPESRYDPSTNRIVPDLTVNFRNGLNLLVDPADAAIIYDIPNSALNPSYSGTTYDGTGVSIGSAGISDLTLADVANYRMAFLGESPGAVNLPTVVVDGADPGLNSAGGEALGDTEISGGIAPKAKIYFYTAAFTDLSSGLLNAVFRALDDNTVSILSMSFGECEAALGTSGNQIILEASEQAAAQGITRTNSAGDGGSAGCDDFHTQSVATQGFAVNGLASTPYDIAVGGTDFDVLSSSFPSYANSSLGAPPYYATALKYIPENPWNDSTSVNTTYSNNVAYKNGNGAGNIFAGSGGSSSVYAKPAFQAALTPSDGYRDLPDVSLLSALGMYGAGWAICTDNVTDGVTTQTYAGCLKTNGQFTSNTVFEGGGGTSLSAPAFAGMMALVAQAHGSPADNYRLGQADVVLYQLAQSKYSTIFHDVTTGNNSVACASGTPDCGTNLFMTGYNAGPGYDLASGLGSVDVAAMVNNWTSVSLASTSTSLNMNGSTTPYTGVHGHAVTFNVAVSPATATGVVAIVDNAAEVNGGVQNNGQLAIPISGGAGSAVYSGLPGGSYTVWARYGGDTANASSTSAMPRINVTITPESSTTTLAINAYDSVTEQTIPGTSIPYGSYVFADAQITGTAERSTTQGVATGTVSFVNGNGTLGSAAVSSSNQASWPTAVGWGGGLGANSGVLSPGSYQIVANYSGDPSYNPSSSKPVAFSVVPATTSFTNQQPSYSVASGQAVTVAFELATKWNPGAAPTGTVSLNVNNQVLGSTSNFGLIKGGSGATLSEYASGSVTIQASQLSNGQNTVTVSYSGDSNYSASSSTINVVSGVAFTLSGGGNILVSPGASSGNSIGISLTPTNGFTGTVNLTCSVSTSLINPIDLPGCALTPASVSVTGTTVVSSTLTISTTAATGSALRQGPFRFGGLTALLALMVWFGIPPRRSGWLRMGIAVALAVSTGALGCGSGGSGSTSTGGGNSGTTPGSYSVTVTGTDAATGKITAHATVNLAVD